MEPLEAVGLPPQSNTPARSGASEAESQGLQKIDKRLDLIGAFVGAMSSVLCSWSPCFISRRFFKAHGSPGRQPGKTHSPYSSSQHRCQPLKALARPHLTPICGTFRTIHRPSVVVPSCASCCTQSSPFGLVSRCMQVTRQDVANVLRDARTAGAEELSARLRSLTS